MTAADKGAELVAIITYAGEEAGKRQSGRLRRSVRRHPTLILGGTVLALMIAMAIVVPILPLDDPMAMNPLQRLKPPSWAHPFGTDNFGRDVMTRSIWGAQVSIVVGLSVAALSTLIGLVIGIISGFYRAADAVIMRFMDGLMSIPSILLAIALVSINKPSIVTLIAAITIVEIPRVVRVVRAVVLTVREQAYVEAAISVGTRPMKLLFSHVLPNALAPIIVQSTFICAVAVLIEASLSFLGVGTPPEVPSWGNMMASARPFVHQASWMLLLPGVMLSITVLSINLVGDGLRDMLDPRFARRLG
jgi:peptide/nickel transport system permease protein